MYSTNPVGQPAGFIMCTIKFMLELASQLWFK
jgi:hypothetical protein